LSARDRLPSGSVAREGGTAEIKRRIQAMRIDSFKDMYLAELQELLSVEVCCAWQVPPLIRR